MPRAAMPRFDLRLTPGAVTPARARLAVDIYTALVIGSVALALAVLTWRLQGYTGVDPAAAPAAPGPASRTDVQPVIALAPFGRVAAQQGPLGQATGLTLKAIFAAVPTSASTALIQTADGKVDAYAIGASVGGATIESILPFSVILQSGTGRVQLSFDPDANGTAPGSGGNPSFPPAGAAPAPLVPAMPSPAAPPPAPVAPQAPSTPPPPASRPSAANTADRRSPTLTAVLLRPSLRTTAVLL